MGVYEGRGQLSKALKELMMRWTEVRSQWRDSVARDFEERFIRSIERDLRKAASAMDHMAIILAQIYRDCEE